MAIAALELPLFILLLFLMGADLAACAVMLWELFYILQYLWALFRKRAPELNA